MRGAWFGWPLGCALCLYRMCCPVPISVSALPQCHCLLPCLWLSVGSTPVSPLPALLRCSEAAPECWHHIWLLLCSLFGNSQVWLLQDTVSVSSAEETQHRQPILLVLSFSISGRNSRHSSLPRYGFLAPAHLPSSSPLPLSPLPCWNLPLPGSLFPTMAIRLRAFCDHLLLHG